MVRLCLKILAYVCIYVCMYACMYVTYVCMYVCMYVCIYIYSIQRRLAWPLRKDDTHKSRSVPKEYVRVCVCVCVCVCIYIYIYMYRCFCVCVCVSYWTSWRSRKEAANRLLLGLGGEKDRWTEARRVNAGNLLQLLGLSDSLPGPVMSQTSHVAFGHSSSSSNGVCFVPKWWSSLSW